MLEAGLANGWLDDLDVVMSGYLPSAAHAELCAHWVARLKERNPAILYLCDPVLGDEPGGVYIEAEAAEAVRDKLVPLADIVTPNRFELSWLTGRDISTPQDAVTATQMLGRPVVLATSAPGLLPDCLSNLILMNGEAMFTNVPRRQVLAHGTGDFIAAAFLAHLLDGRSESEALALASAAMEITIEASDGLGELALIDSQEQWSRAAPAALYSLPQPEAADCL
jgi:pyridoxine kinase